MIHYLTVVLMGFTLLALCYYWLLTAWDRDHEYAIIHEMFAHDLWFKESKIRYWHDNVLGKEFYDGENDDQWNCEPKRHEQYYEGLAPVAKVRKDHSSLDGKALDDFWFCFWDILGKSFGDKTFVLVAVFTLSWSLKGEKMVDDVAGKEPEDDQERTWYRVFIPSAIGVISVNIPLIWYQRDFYPLESRLLISSILVMFLSFYLYYIMSETLKNIGISERNSDR